MATIRKVKLTFAGSGFILGPVFNLGPAVMDDLESSPRYLVQIEASTLAVICRLRYTPMMFSTSMRVKHCKNKSLSGRRVIPGQY